MTARERAVIFTGHSVRAMRADEKTETRRVVNTKTKPDESLVNVGRCTFDLRIPHHIEAALKLCPYGVPGDLIWVREAFSTNYFDGGGTAYRADFDADALRGVVTPPKWKSPLFMPRALSRVTLEILSVRVERLHDITEEGALAEGVKPLRLSADESYTAREQFALGWDAINGKRAPWGSNPWVRVVVFRRLEVPHA